MLTTVHPGMCVCVISSNKAHTFQSLFIPIIINKCVFITERVCPLVAGSVGPYGACLCDGSEYTGAYVDNITSKVRSQRAFIFHYN